MIWTLTLISAFLSDTLVILFYQHILEFDINYLLKLLCCSVCQCGHAKERWVYAAKVRWSFAACSWATQMPPLQVTHYLNRLTFSHARPLILSYVWYDLMFHLLLHLLFCLPCFVCYKGVGLLTTYIHTKHFKH